MICAKDLYLDAFCLTFVICPKYDISGGYSGGVPPLPIPNREVKPACADGTAHPWESRQPPFFQTREIPPERHTVPEGFSVLGLLLFVFLFLFGLFDIAVLLKISNRLFLLFFIVTIVYGKYDRLISLDFQF